MTAAGTRHARPGVVLAVVAVGTLLSALANASVSLALPAIGGEMAASLDVTSWVMLAMLLSVTVLLMPFGRAGDLFGHGTVYLAGFVVFALASTLCGLAPNIWLLIAGRALQGVGGAAAMASGPALLTTTFPGHQRGRALGAVATATYVGLTLGPPLGGWLMSWLGWRWIFFLNIPLTAVIFGLGAVYLPRGSGHKVRSFDWPGALALLGGLPLLLLALTHAASWGTARTALAAAGGVTALAAFGAIETKRAEPLLDPRLFRTPMFTGATLSALANYVALFVSIILMPFYLMEALGLGPDRAGLLLAAQPLLMALVAAPSGWVSDRLGTRGLTAAGLTILAAGLGGLSTVGAATSPWAVAGWLAVMGLGTGIFISPNSSALMGAAPAARQGTASGVMALARNLGMMIGVASATALFHTAGGQTDGAWKASDFEALHLALLVAAGVSLAGAAVSWVMKREKD